LTVAADGTCEQPSGDIPFSIASVVDQEFENIKMRLKVQGARPDKIAPKRGRFWEFQGLAAPVDLTAEVDFSRQDGLRSAEIEMEISEGRFTFLRENETKSYPIHSLIARAALAPGEERMDVSRLDFTSPNLSFKASGFLTELGLLSDGDANSSPVFNLSAQNIRMNMTPRFPTEKNQIKTVRFESTMSGTLTHEELLMLWPVNAFVGARQWIDRAILAGDLTKVEAEVNLDESFFDAPTLTADRFKLLFAGHGFDVKYMMAMPSANGVRGEGELIGNRLGVKFNGGKIMSVDVHDGEVDIPVILPFGGDVIVTANGRSAIRNCG